MESKTNYTLVGLMVLILASGLIIACLWLSSSFDQKAYNTYIVYTRDSVSGLSDDSPVKYNGVRVGRVSSIQLTEFDPQLVKIQLQIEQDTPITTSTRATLITQGITGVTYLGLFAKTSSYLPLQSTPGEPYPVIPSTPSFFNQLDKNINDVSLGFKRVFSEKNAENLSKSLRNLEKLSNALAENDRNISKSLAELPELLRAFKKGLRQFNTMASDLSVAGQQVTDTMQAGRVSIDKLTQQTLPPAILLLRRLDLIAANLEGVSAQMRQNPAVIIRGNTPPKPGPGE